MSDLRDHVVPLHKQTLQEGVFRRLCELILEGGLAPGQSITVAHLAEAFGVSPMPVREALTKLTGAGVLTVVSGRTIGIPKLTLARLEDLRRVRLEVETTAVRWATERQDASLIASLTQAFRRLEEAEKNADAQHYIRANYDFHFHLYRHAGSPILLTIIENLWLQISPYFHLLRESGNFRISNHQHAAVFEGVRSRDPARAAKALAADIEGAYRVLALLIEQEGRSGRVRWDARKAASAPPASAPNICDAET